MPEIAPFKYVLQGVHLASEMGEFLVYNAEFSCQCLVVNEYFLFRRGASLKIFSCNVAPFFFFKNKLQIVNTQIKNN